MLEQILQADLPDAALVELCDHARGDQAVASQLEEVAVVCDRARQ